MAPTAPAKRRSIRAKALERLANPLLPRKVHRPDAAVTDAFLETKRDKRLIKHSSFVSKISKDHPSRSASAQKKRRRPSKKLVATLESLADALPELTEEDGDAAAALGSGKVRHRSLRSRPGALKRKERIVRGEMERFGVSLAQLTATKEEPASQQTSVQTSSMQVEGAALDAKTTVGAPATSTSNRWAALRGFISATMEQNPAFTSKG